MPEGNNNFKIPGCGTHHIAVQSYDWEASLRLYCEVLGMRVVEEFGLPDRKIILLDIGDGSHMEICWSLSLLSYRAPAYILKTHI